MTPTIVFKNNSFYAALGSPGGSRIISLVCNAALALIDFGLNATGIVNAPRVVTTNQGWWDLALPLYDDVSLRGELAALGFNNIRSHTGGTSVAITNINGVFDAATFPQIDGAGLVL